MRSIQLRSRFDTLCALGAAAVASVAILGASVLLFAGAGETPTFAAGSGLALEASRCSEVPSVQERHRCLRQVAAARSAEPATVIGALDEPPQP